jgi:hypothetical protein
MQSPVPALSHSLTALSTILKKAEAHCEAHKIAPDVMLNARLYPDMMHLTRNVQTVCDTAKGAAARLSQTENPSFMDDEATFEQLQARIQKTLEFMASVPEIAFDGAEDREVVLPAGGDEFKFSGAGYMATFVMPNFYFHMATVHGILRHNGVVIGKRDFLGA